MYLRYILDLQIYKKTSFLLFFYSILYSQLFHIQHCLLQFQSPMWSIDKVVWIDGFLWSSSPPPQGFFQKAMVLHAMGQTDESLQVFLQCLAMDDNFTRARSQVEMVRERWDYNRYIVTILFSYSHWSLILYRDESLHMYCYAMMGSKLCIRTATVDQRYSSAVIQIL